MSIRSYIPSSLTVGFITSILVIGLSIAGFGVVEATVDDTQNVGATVTMIREITAPEAVNLSVERGSSTSANAGDLTFTSDFAELVADDKITVSASQPSNPVEGAELNIKGGDLSDWSKLWSYDGTHDTPSVTVDSSIASATGTIGDLQYQLDASDVDPGTANIGSQFNFTITFTIGQA